MVHRGRGVHRTSGPALVEAARCIAEESLEHTEAPDCEAKTQYNDSEPTLISADCTHYAEPDCEPAPLDEVDGESAHTALEEMGVTRVTVCPI